MTDNQFNLAIRGGLFLFIVIAVNIYARVGGQGIPG
jgi:hypothetical protein